MFDDAPVRLPYNTGLERSLLTVLAVFGDQLSRFLGEFYPTSAFDHALPAACAPLLAEETVCMALAVNALESKPSSLSQRSMVPASPRKTMPCSSWMMVTLFVSSGLLFPVLASALPSPPSNGMSSFGIVVDHWLFPSNPLGSSNTTGRRVGALGSGGEQV